MAVIAVVTVAFVIGTVIERNSGESHEADRATEPVAHKTGGEARETAEAQTSKPGAAAEPTSDHAGEPSELTPLGIDIEAAPFVALAAIASLALAIAARLRPRTVPLLCLVALAMLVFAALDIQEVVHQSDEARTGLAILAACVAALHLIAAALATVMTRDARRRHAGHPAGAARSPA